MRILASWCFVSLKTLATHVPWISRELSLLSFPSDIQQAQETVDTEIWKCIWLRQKGAKPVILQSLNLYCLLNHTESLSITIFSYQLCSVPYLSHCSLFDQALRNELCVLKIQVFIYLSQVFLFSAGTLGHLHTVCKKLQFVYLAYK